MNIKKVYLAGPDVFRPEAKEIGCDLKALCQRFGLMGLYPLDNDAPGFENPQDIANWIANANMDLIRQADYVVANLNPFRGLEPDSGTVFEVGMAVALGKPVFAYLSDLRPMNEKVPMDADRLDADGNHVENFDLPLNLMIACTTTGIHADAESALRAVAAHSRRQLAE